MTESGPGGHRYEVVSDTKISWDKATAAAQAGGGFLASVGDAAEQAFVEKLLTDANAPSGSYWFGLHESLTEEGQYAHVSGTVPVYTHWAVDQPDNFGKAESSGSLLWSNLGDPTYGRRGLWNDLPARGGYPQVKSVYPDLDFKGYLVEFPGVGGSFENGDGDSTLVGNRPPTAVPLPAAVGLFPVGAALAAYAIRRQRRASGV